LEVAVGKSKDYLTGEQVQNRKELAGFRTPLRRWKSTKDTSSGNPALGLPEKTDPAGERTFGKRCLKKPAEEKGQ